MWLRIWKEAYMSKNTYTVAPGHEFNYPADLVSLKIVKNAGGRSKLTADQKPLVKYKVAKAGDDCGDMPKDTLELYLSRGWVLKNTKPVTEKDGD